MQRHAGIIRSLIAAFDGLHEFNHTSGVLSESLRIYQLKSINITRPQTFALATTSSKSPVFLQDTVSEIPVKIAPLCPTLCVS